MSFGIFQMTKSKKKHTHIRSYSPHKCFWYLVSVCLTIFFFIHSCFVCLFAALLRTYPKLPAKMCNHENTHWIIFYIPFALLCVCVCAPYVRCQYVFFRSSVISHYLSVSSTHIIFTQFIFISICINKQYKYE